MAGRRGTLSYLDGLDIKKSPLFAKMRASVESHEEQEAERRRKAAGGWEELYDEATQSTYYYSPRTGQTRWEKPEDDDELDTCSGWFYEGREGEERGPHPLESMRAWYEHGYFPEGTMVRTGSSGPFREVHNFPEICGGAAKAAERADILAQVAEGVPPSVEPEALAAVKAAQVSSGAVLEHPTARRAQRRASVRSRTQQRRAANDSDGSELLSSQLREEKARNSALQAELDELRRAYAEEKVQLQMELVQLERARDAHDQQSRNSAVRQPCVAIFYEELPGRPSHVVPIEKARELVESAVIVDGTKVWAEGMLDWRPFREVKSQMGNLGEVKAASVAATFFYELRSGEVSQETPTKELERLLVQLLPGDSLRTPEPAVNRFTKVWTEGLEDWKRLGEVEHLLLCSDE